jgi:hypothetical protein
MLSFMTCLLGFGSGLDLSQLNPRLQGRQVFLFLPVNHYVSPARPLTHWFPSPFTSPDHRKKTLSLPLNSFPSGQAP